MPIYSLAERIQTTLEAYDPGRLTICIGGAALHLQLAEAGITPNNTKDAEALCTDEFYDDLLISGPRRQDLMRFGVDWENGGKQKLGFLEGGITLEPSDRFRNRRIKCTFARGIGSPHTAQITYAEANEDELVVVGGIRCISVARILEDKAKIGRRKDVGAVHRYLPLARKAGLVSVEQFATIKAHNEESAALRAAYPDRFYARIKAGYGTTQGS